MIFATTGLRLQMLFFLSSIPNQLARFFVSSEIDSPHFLLYNSTQTLLHEAKPVGSLLVF